MASTQFSSHSSGHPRIYAHRGSSLRAPENTMKAFTLGLDEGADGVECDVRRCASGEIVVVHDATMLRVAGARARVADLSYSQLRDLDVGSNERVPRLDDLLDLIVSRNALANVEVKADDDDKLRLARGVAHVLERRAHKDREHVIFSTFHPFVCAYMRSLLPKMPVGFLFENDRQGRALGLLTPTVLRVAAVHPNYTLVNEQSVARWRRRKLLINVWTVDDTNEARRLAALHVDGIITNDVRRIREALSNP